MSIVPEEVVQFPDSDYLELLMMTMMMIIRKMMAKL